MVEESINFGQCDLYPDTLQKVAQTKLLTDWFCVLLPALQQFSFHSLPWRLEALCKPLLSCVLSVQANMPVVEHFPPNVWKTGPRHPRTFCWIILDRLLPGVGIPKIPKHPALKPCQNCHPAIWAPPYGLLVFIFLFACQTEGLKQKRHWCLVWFTMSPFLPWLAEQDNIQYHILPSAQPFLTSLKYPSPPVGLCWINGKKLHCLSPPSGFLWCPGGFRSN